MPILDKGEDSDYVPAYSVSIPRLKTRYHRSKSGNFNSFLDSLWDDPNTPNYIKIVIDRLRAATSSGGPTNDNNNKGVEFYEQIELAADMFPEVFSEYTNSPIKYNLPNLMPMGSSNSYDNLFASLEKNGWSKINLRNKSYLVNYYSCFEVLGPTTVVPVFIMVTKPEFMEYFRYCILTGRNPRSEIFEFWVTPGFDKPRGEYKNLRSRWRKDMKKDLVQQGITIKEMPDMLKSLFISISIPEGVKTIKQTRKWLGEASKGAMSFLKSKHKLEGSNVELNL